MPNSEMTTETIVAVYDTAAEADAAVADLRSAGIADSAITREAGETGMRTTPRPAREQGFWAGLFGGEPDHDTSVYDRSVQGGSTVVSVMTEDHMAERVMDILDRHHPVDMDERAAGYDMARTNTTAATIDALTPTATDDATISLSEERLVVGKRLVNRGGTRIRRFVIETPVERQVSLHEERVTIERRPVTDGRVAADADFSDRTIQMTETAEQAVVEKTAYVTEEIRLRKEATERTETIRDTVRREDVEIVQLPADTATSSTIKR